MVDRIGSGGLASAAIEAALRRQSEAAARIGHTLPTAAQPDSAVPANTQPFANQLSRGLQELDGAVKQGESVHLEILSGQMTNLHEVAARIKQSDLTFKFALATRNKLVEAYREIMRMGV